MGTLVVYVIIFMLGLIIGSVGMLYWMLYVGDR